MKTENDTVTTPPDDEVEITEKGPDIGSTVPGEEPEKDTPATSTPPIKVRGGQMSWWITSQINVTPGVVNVLSLSLLAT